MHLQALRTDQAPAAIGPYSQGIVVDRLGLVFVCGQLGMDPATQQLVEGGVEDEFRRAVRNAQAVLAAAGCTLADVVRVTLYLTDMGDFAAVNAAYAEFFSQPYPSRSTVEVAGLPKGGRVEVEVTAAREGFRPLSH